MQGETNRRRRVQRTHALGLLISAIASRRQTIASRVRMLRPRIAAAEPTKRALRLFMSLQCTVQLCHIGI